MACFDVSLFFSDMFSVLIPLGMVAIGMTEAYFCQKDSDARNDCVSALLWSNILAHSVYNMAFGVFCLFFTIWGLLQRTERSLSVKIALSDVNTTKLGLAIWSLVLYYQPSCNLEYVYEGLWIMLEIETVIFYFNCACLVVCLSVLLYQYLSLRY